MKAPGRWPGADLFIDLSGRAKLRVSGGDRVRFINGQISNDVRKASGFKAIEACVLNAKGKMEAHLFVRADGDCFYLDAAPELRPALQLRLERYVIADDVIIEDVTDEFALFHVLSANPVSVAGTSQQVRARRFANDGHDLWVEAKNRDHVLEQLQQQFRFCDETCAEILRVEQGIPRWGCELTNEIIPLEANLEERAIDYAKGCYIGQETISRMKMSGQRNKALCGLLAVEVGALSPGMRLRDDAGKEAGWITSAVSHPKFGQRLALGYVKRGFGSAGSRLQASDDGRTTSVKVQMVELPFSDSPVAAKAIRELRN